MKRFLLSVAFLLGIANAAMAQGAPPSPIGAAVVCNTCYTTLLATNISSNVALPGSSPPYNAIIVRNNGTVDAYVAQGTSTVTATSSNILVRAGNSITMWVSGTYLAAITASSTTTLDIYQGNGAALLQNSGSSGGGSVTITGSLPAGTNLIGKVGIDQTTPGTTNGVQLTNTTVSTGGYEFNASVIPTVQNAAYAAGQSLGGLQTISIGSTNSLTGILTQLRAASKGGSTVSVVFYVWDKNPAATTCTDKSNFVVSQTDNQHLVVSPQSVALALAVSAQDTTTYGAAPNLSGNFVNSSTNTDLYVCVLASAAVTPATTSDYRFNIQGVKDQP